MHGNVKWDNEKLIAIMNMRMNGESLQQIADKYGCTRENIRQILGRGARILRCGNQQSKKVIYPNIRRFMFENEVTILDIANGIGFPYSNMHNWLCGKTNVSLTIAFKIARFLEMTVDEAFATDEPSENIETVPERECVEGA